MHGFIFIIIWVFFIRPIEAATQTSTITITIPALVQISGLSDIALLPINIASSVQGNTTACVYSNNITPLGSYFVTATSTNASAGSFRVKQGSSFITYNAFWNNTSSPIQSTALSSGAKTALQTGASSTSLSCGGTPNANFNLSFSASQIAGAPPGVYTDTVTILISPS
jgi:hypothetical protein